MSIVRSKIIVDLGFGDSGKGLVVDSLCEKASRPLVVRYTGGPQAGHTVVRDGKRHVFSSFGSGTLQGHPSFFGPETLIYLPNLIREYRKLQDLNGNIPIQLFIDPRAKVITPADVALGRIRERFHKHGSCGLGVGAAMSRHEHSPLMTPAGMLNARSLFDEQMEVITVHAQKMAEGLRKVGADDWVLSEFKEELEIHTRDWVNAIESFSHIRDIRILNFGDTLAKIQPHMLVFEGAQGVMLDRDFGCFPNVTYGHTSSKHAWSLLRESGIMMPADVTYVHRCYTTRHGSGWMPSEWDEHETGLALMGIEGETNVMNEWQGEFRRGEIDFKLVHAAMNYDRSFHRADASCEMVFTCMDQRPGFSLPMEELRLWGLEDIKINASPESGRIKLA